MLNERRIALRYLKEQKKRTVLLVFGIVLATALVASIFSCLVALQKFEVVMESANGVWHVAVKNCSESQANELKNRADVSGFGIALDVEGVMLDSNIAGDLMGCGEGGAEQSNMTITAGKPPYAANEIAVEQWVLDHVKKGAKVGDTLSVTLSDGTKKDFVLSAILKNNSSNMQYNYLYAMISLPEAQALNHTKNFTALMQVQDNVKIKTFMQNIEQDQKIDSQNVVAHKSLLAVLGRWESNTTNGIYAVGAVLALLVLLAAIVMIYNGFNISVRQRVRQFGMLRALGASPKQIRKVVRSESTFVWILGTVPGLFISFFVTAILIAFLKHFVPEIFPQEGPDFVFSPLALFAGALIGFLTTYLSSLLPARRAGKISPVEAISGTQKQNIRKKQMHGGAVKVLPVESALSLRQILLSKRSFVLTGVSLSIGIILMMSFEPLMQMLHFGTAHIYDFGDFFLTQNVQESSGRFAEFSEDTINAISKIDGVDAVYPKRLDAVNATFDYSLLGKEYNRGVKDGYYAKISKNSDGTASAGKSTLIGLTDEDIRNLSDKLVFGNADPGQLDRENGVIIALNTMGSGTPDIGDLRPGDFIQIGSDKLKICGIIQNDGLSTGIQDKPFMGIYTTNHIFEQFSAKKPIMIAVTMKPGANGDQVLQSLKEATASLSGSNVEDYRDSKQMGNQITLAGNVFVYGFIAVIALIGVLNIINTVSTNIFVRTREIGLLRAGGMTVPQVTAMIVTESALYGVFALIVGIAAGIPLEHKFYELMVLQTYSVPWTMPWNILIISGVMTVAAVYLSVLSPIKRVKQLAITESITAE